MRSHLINLHWLKLSYKELQLVYNTDPAKVKSQNAKLLSKINMQEQSWNQTKLITNYNTENYTIWKNHRENALIFKKKRKIDSELKDVIDLSKSKKKIKITDYLDASKLIYKIIITLRSLQWN